VAPQTCHVLSSHSFYDVLSALPVVLKKSMPLQRGPFAKRIPDILKEAHHLLFEKTGKRLSES
jgi:hypothetical protein